MQNQIEKTPSEHQPHIPLTEISGFKDHSDNFAKAEIKKCPKCSSVFVTDDECESCGFQFGINYLGEPLDEKSFYSLQENYVNELKRSYFSSTIKKLTANYLRAVLHRFDVLVEHFTTPDNQNFEFFSYELKSVIEELLNLKMDAERIKFRSIKNATPAIKKYISEIIFQWQNQKPVEHYPTSWGFFLFHSRNLRISLAFMAWILVMGYLVLRSTL